jgi:hypothetical protein
MRCSASSTSACRRAGLSILGSLVVLSAIGAPVRAATYHMVDSQTNTGDMRIDMLGYSYGSGQWNFNLKASNTGSQTYNDVNLVFQFVWDTATTPRPSLTFASSNSWALGSTDSLSIASYSVGAGPSQSPFAFPHSDADTPLTWGDGAFQSVATVQATDSFPALALGNFTPGATENFTLVCPANNFNPNLVGFYVAVPEPSSIALAMFAGAGLLGYAWRRRQSKN